MIAFTKMHGAGNDFILVRKEDVTEDYAKFAERVCHRHFGIGGDGMMMASMSSIADIKMDYYNSDGSIGEMCGNGIRCFSRFVYEKGMVKTKSFTVETLAGTKRVELYEEGAEFFVSVSMGLPELTPGSIPVVSEKPQFIEEDIETVLGTFKVSTILMGVPHTILFVEDIEKININEIGPLIEVHKVFPKKTNVNFVQILGEDEIFVDTWERGAGRTLACGTGVTACAYLARELGKITSKEVKVKVRGGNLKIQISDDGNLMMTGNASKICEGNYF